MSGALIHSPVVAGPVVGSNEPQVGDEASGTVAGERPRRGAVARERCEAWFSAKGDGAAERRARGARSTAGMSARTQACERRSMMPPALG